MSEHNGSTGFPPRTMARHVGGFAHDLVSLTELQAELLKADTQECFQRMTTPLVLLGMAIIGSIGCVPVALTAFAYGLVAAAGLSTWLAFLIAATTGLILAGLAAAIGWRLLVKSPSVFERSKDEFNSNLCWVKRVLTTSGERPRST